MHWFALALLLAQSAHPPPPQVPAPGTPSEEGRDQSQRDATMNSLDTQAPEQEQGVLSGEQAQDEAARQEAAPLSPEDRRVAYGVMLERLSHADTAAQAGQFEVASELLPEHSRLESLIEHAPPGTDTSEMLFASDASRWMTRAQRALQENDSIAARNDIERAEEALQHARTIVSGE
jgi:hypothetical protein